MATVYITCRTCDGTGIENNPPIFSDEGETPDVSVNCPICDGRGTIPEDNPIGIRVSWLVAQQICEEYPNMSIDHVYSEIVTNISNATNHHSHTMEYEIEDGDLLFSLEQLPNDDNLDRIIARGNFIDEAKLILNLT